MLYNLKNSIFVFVFLIFLKLINVDFKHWSIIITVLIPCCLILITDAIKLFKSKTK